MILGATKPGNMGEAIARRFADEGASLVLAGRDLDGLNRLSSTLSKDRMSAVESCDISDEAQVAGLARGLIKKGITVDIIVNAVGVTASVPLEEASQEKLDWLMRVNLQGPVFIIKHLCPLMQRGGSVIMISSTTAASHKYTPTRIPYIVSKTALNRLVQASAIELGQQGIQINAIAPGLVITPMGAAAVGDLGAQLEHRLLQKTPLGRLATVADIASTALFLAGGSYFDTGQIIEVNGGFSLMDNGFLLNSEK